MDYEKFATDIASEDMQAKTKILLNGNWIGFTESASTMVQALKIARQMAQIPYEVSIVKDILQKEIKIYTDCGRCIRPLFKVENNKLKITQESISGSF